MKWSVRFIRAGEGVRSPTPALGVHLVAARCAVGAGLISSRFPLAGPVDRSYRNWTVNVVSVHCDEVIYCIIRHKGEGGGGAERSTTSHSDKKQSAIRLSL